MTDILSEAKELGEYMVYCRRTLHAIAEIGFELEETLRFVKGELEAMGIKAEKCGRAGLSALIGRGESCFMLRSDMDALPMTEETGLSFASKRGGFHGCGHDAHTAMLLGAAKLLKRHEGELSRPVKLMFQSAEESLEGAKDMIEAGILSSPRVEGALMLHVLTGLSLPAGSIIVPEAGISAPGADFFEIEVLGRGCHGSSPGMGVDPISAGAHIVVALQEIFARELAPGEQAALSIGSIHGGEAANVIPERLVMKGSLRALSDETREFLKARLEEIACLTAKSFRAEARLRFTSGCPGLLNDASLRERVLESCREALGPERVFTAAELSQGREGRMGGSEDFARVSREVPSLMLALAAGEPERGYVHPLHHPKADFDEAALPYGAAVLAGCALNYQSLS